MDTLTINEKLKQAGVAEQQAQAVTGAIQEGVHEAEEYADDAVEEGKKELAKQADIVSLRQDFHKVAAELLQDNAKLRQNLAELKSDLSLLILKAVVGSLLAATAMFGVIVTIVLQIITKS